MSMKMAVSNFVSKPTIPPLLFRMTYYNCLRNKASNITKFYPTSTESAKNENMSINNVTRYCKTNTGKIISKNNNFVEKSFIPFRFKPEASVSPSRLQPSCNDYPKTRLHSMPLTSILENLGTDLAPHSPFVADYRWYDDARRPRKARRGNIPKKNIVDPKRSNIPRQARTGNKKKRMQNLDGVLHLTRHSLNHYREKLVNKAKRHKSNKVKKARPRKPS